MNKKTEKSEDEIERFIKTPEIGNKVKIYFTGNKQRYGTVVKIIESQLLKREVLILEESEEVFRLEDCDYCLENNSSVMFKEEFNGSI